MADTPQRLELGDDRVTRLRDAKKRAWALFGAKDGIEGIGLGRDGLRVYVRDSEIGRGLPGDVDGVRLEPIVVGRIVAAA
jgi:hypothetical protein